MQQKLIKLRDIFIRSEFLIALAIGISLIIIGVGLGYENNKIVPVNAAQSAHYLQEPANHLSFLSNWDGPIYLSIAQHGYTNKSQANFFPLYPILVRFVHLLIPSLLDSGLTVAWVCFVGAIYFYLKIFKLLYQLKDNLEAIKGTLFFVLFPTGVFLIATYTESLFAFLALAAIYYALKDKYLVSLILSALSTATHATGVFVAALIGFILLEKGFNIFKSALGVILGCLGLISYMVYQYIKFGSPLEFVNAQKLHSWVNLSGSHFINELVTLNGFFLLLIAISVIYWWRRRKSFALYEMLYLSIIFISGRDFGGFGRYALMAFPQQIMFYDYSRKKKLTFTVILILSVIFWSFVTLRYAGAYTGG